jgi:hypothetical protein
MSFGASIPVKEVLVGADFAASEESEAQRAISNSLDMDLINKYTLSYMLTSGDPVIAEAWSNCMLRNAGFYVWFGPRQGKATTVNVEFHSPKDRYQEFKVSDVQWSQIELSGGKRVMTPISNECLRPGRKYKSGDKCTSVLDSVESSSGVLLVVNGLQSSWWQFWGGTTDSSTAFLPPNMKWVPLTDRVVSRSLNPPVISSRSESYDKNGSRAYGLPEVCVDRAQVGGDSVSFIKSSASVVRDAPCQGSDGSCIPKMTAITDLKFCWSGEMVVDEKKSCTCTATGAINVLKSRWVPMTLVPAQATD